MALHKGENILKHLEGKTVYLIATGNLARRHNGCEVLQAVIVKVARVNVTFQIEGRMEQKWRISSNGKTLESGCNSGYKVFDSLEDIADHNDSGKIIGMIATKFRGYGDMKVTVENLRKAADLLSINWRD